MYKLRRVKNNDATRRCREKKSAEIKGIYADNERMREAIAALTKQVEELQRRRQRVPSCRCHPNYVE